MNGGSGGGGGDAAAAAAAANANTINDALDPNFDLNAFLSADPAKLTAPIPTVKDKYELVPAFLQVSMRERERERERERVLVEGKEGGRGREREMAVMERRLMHSFFGG
jgi:hypothetical protein